MTKDNEVKELIARAAKAEKSEDAMRFSQAACNCANALASLANTELAVQSNQRKEELA